MIKTSKEANINYLAKVVKLKNLKRHINADRLQTVDIDFQTVITGMDAKDGDIYVYFPIESKINKDFLLKTNSFRNKELNIDKTKTGFFEDNCRVKAMKLRNEKSMGYIVPAKLVYDWAEDKQDPEVDTDKEFDTINGIKMVEKYQVQQRVSNNTSKNKKPKVSRIINGQVHLHVDTENLRKNAYKIDPDDLISLTYKTHGTSFWVANVLVKRKLTLIEKVLNWVGLPMDDLEYDYVYGSRRVVKNADMDNPKQKDNFYGYDLWEKVKDEIKDGIPKGYTVYGEMLGYDHNGGYIQKGFDYGCKDKEHKLEVYRVTNTTPDGLVTELSYPQIQEFCEEAHLIPSHLFYYGKAKDINFLTAGLLDYSDKEVWRDYFVKCLEEDYNDKNCFMCSNTVPEEGIVLRVESLFTCESYKLKSFSFLEYETKELDKGETDLESEN